MLLYKFFEIFFINLFYLRQSKLNQKIFYNILIIIIYFTINY